MGYTTGNRNELFEAPGKQHQSSDYEESDEKQVHGLWNFQFDPFQPSIIDGEIYQPPLGDMIEPRLWPRLDKERSEKAISIARSLGIPAEAFAIHDFDDEPVPFLVATDKFSGQVFPMDLVNGKAPRSIQEQFDLLGRNGVEFDHYAIAVWAESDRHLSLHDVMDIAQGIKGIREQFGSLTARRRILGLGRQAIKMVREIVSENSSFPIMRQHGKPPILLGCYGWRPCFFVSLGGWEQGI